MLRRLNPVAYVKRRVAIAYQRRVDSVKARIDQIAVPVRFQGTVIEHWARYWKFLIKDYGSVLFGIVKDAKNRPVRALLIYGTGAVAYSLSQVNPDDEEFRQQLKHYCHEVGMLPDSMQNPVARDHLITLERLYATGTLRRLNLGVASIFWRHDNNPELKTYQAICDFVGPDWTAFGQRIVDVGFLGRLWTLERQMKDYDVNSSS